MKGISKLSYKTLVFLVIAALVFPTVLYVFTHRQETRTSALGDLEGSVEQIVADISNLTGASSEEITQLKQSGLSWNQILERLKFEKGSYTQEREARSSLLTEKNMEETVIKLRSSGFSDEDIQGAKLIAERVEFQLKEIVGASAVPSSPAIPVAGELEPKGDNLKKEAAQSLAEKYDSAAAVYYLLALKEELGDTSNVMDEYLLSLQFDLDLQFYMEDRDAYLKDKEVKTAGHLPDSMITVAYIEELLLEQINQRAVMNSGHSPTPSTGINQKNSTASEEVNIDRPSEGFSVPEVPNVNPVNPSEQIQQELDALNPNLP